MVTAATRGGRRERTNRQSGPSHYILLPMALETFSDDDGATSGATRQQYGWCLVEPCEGYQPPSAAGPPQPAEVPAEQGPRTPNLADAFTALREVVRQATGPGKPMAGAASVKTRLGRSLGAFDERTFGFSKFKDFLLAAQREGYVQVESVGPATRVALPREGQG